MTGTNAARGPGLWSRELRPATVGLVLTVTLIAFEALAVGTVMPLVSRDLGDPALYGWAFSGFFLASLLGIVVAGALNDARGPRATLAVGIVVFGVGLVVGGAALSMPMLIAGRVLQGLGAGTLQPTAYVIISRVIPDRARPQMFATLSAAWVVPGLAGPAIAALVGEAAGWRAVFLGLVPLLVLAGVLTLAAIGRFRDLRQQSTDTVRIPIRSTAILVAGAAILLAGLSSSHLVLMLIGGAGGLVLLAPALRTLMPAGTFRARRGAPSAVLLRGILTFAFMGIDAYVALAIAEWRGAGVLVAGLTLTIATITWSGAAFVQARIVNRLGPARLVRAGFAMVAIGIAGFALVLVPGVPIAVGVVTWALAAAGMGFAYSPVALVLLRDVARGQEGRPTAALSLSDMVGTTLGAGIGGALVAVGVSAGFGIGWALAGTSAVTLAAALAGVALAGRLTPAPTVELLDGLPDRGDPLPHADAHGGQAVA